ncbi:hypothetical protein Pelo_1336 [Pelomyxa schiedti]|nr:hypothetical protein Pelo_1336 [Pelomyxa schiedti]
MQLKEQEPTIQRDAAEYIRSVYHWEAEPFCATGHTERSQRATELTQEFKQEPHNGNQRTETLRFNIPSNGPVTGYSCTTARQTVHTEVYGWNQAPFSSPLNSTSHGKHKL